MTTHSFGPNGPDTMTDESKTYLGTDFDSAGPGTVIVEPDGRELPTGLDHPELPSHSPDGFQCGYGGSGPAQLSAALLFDVTHDVDLTNRHYQAFKRDVVSNLKDGFTLDGDFIADYVAMREAESIREGR